MVVVVVAMVVAVVVVVVAVVVVTVVVLGQQSAQLRAPVQQISSGSMLPHGFVSLVALHPAGVAPVPEK